MGKVIEEGGSKPSTAQSSTAAMEPRQKLAPQNSCPLPCDEIEQADIDIVVSHGETREERSMTEEDGDYRGGRSSHGTGTHCGKSARSTDEAKMSRASTFGSNGFSCVGPFFHIMLSYGVATEGDGGNSFATQLYKASNSPFLITLHALGPRP